MSAIIPAVLVRDRAELDRALKRLAAVPSIRAVQVDVVDGRFASPASWPYTERDPAAAVRQGGECLPGADRFALDIDLMVEDPLAAAAAWLDCGARRLTLHLESLAHPAAAIAHLKARCGDLEGPCPFEVGLALSLATDLALLEPLLAKVEYVQLMGIATIGRQGEPFDERVLDRVRALRERHPKLAIQIDGGVSEANARALLAAGADRLVVGHRITRADDPAVAFEQFSALLAHNASYTASMPLTDHDIAAIAEKANEIRQTVIEMLVAAGSGHTAGPLGMADIFAALYFHILRHHPQDPDWEERDRLVLSNGHICPVRYAAMAHAGYFPLEECLTLRKFGSRLQGHPERIRLPGLETTSGPLGEGLAQAAGMAYALHMDGRTERVYCVMSDGEQDEGNVWEAALFAGKYKLRNLTAIMDRNNIQIDGVTEDVMPLEPIADKYRAFGWHVLECSGHDIGAFIRTVEEAKTIYEKPTVIIAHTIPGRGVPEIEYDYHWHGKPPSKEEGKRFLAQLRTLAGRLPHEYA